MCVLTQHPHDGGGGGGGDSDDNVLSKKQQFNLERWKLPNNKNSS